MLKERYVSYELAELLKENGFDEPTPYRYICRNLMNTPYNIRCKNSEMPETPSAPTIQMAKEWVENNCNIFIEVSIYSDEELSMLALPEGTRYTWNLYNNTTGNIRPFNGYGKTPWETLEEAIKFCIKTFCKNMEERKISHPAEPMRVGSLVRWREYPERLYYIKEMPVSHCGHDDYAKIESVDHIWMAVLPISELVLDDVDYDER